MKISDFADRYEIMSRTLGLDSEKSPKPDVDSTSHPEPLQQELEPVEEGIGEGTVTRLFECLRLGREGLYLAQHHPRQSEVRRKLKVINQQLRALVGFVPADVSLPPNTRAPPPSIFDAGPNVPDPQFPLVWSMTRSQIEATRAESPTRHDEVAEAATHEVAVLGPQVSRKPKGVKAPLPIPEPQPTGVVSDSPEVTVPVTRSVANLVESQPKAPVTRPNPQVEWLAVKSRFPMVGLFRKPRSRKERSYAKAVLSLIDKFGRDPCFPEFRVHPADNQRANRFRSRRLRGEIALLRAVNKNFAIVSRELMSSLQRQGVPLY
jgi:hypothetical protein